MSQYKQITHEVEKSRLSTSDGYSPHCAERKEKKNGKKKVTNKLNDEGRKGGANHHYNKQAQQVTTIDCGFANRPPDNYLYPT